VRRINNLLAMTVAGSAVVVLMLLLRPVTAKCFPAVWQYRIGKMAIVFFLVPVSLFAEKLALILSQPVTQNQYSGISPMPVPAVEQKNGLLNAINAVDATIEQHLTIEVMQVVSTIWLFGAIGFAVWHLYCYRRFMKLLQANSIPAPEDTAVPLSSCKKELGIRCNVKLMQNPTIVSPMLVGLLRPMILLPTIKIQEIDLKLVLTHELTHLKHKDLWVKILALMMGALHWFNPFVYVLRKDIGRWSELSCDEMLATKMSLEEKRLYGEAILNTLDVSSGTNIAFCSYFCESRKHMKRRLTMLLKAKKIKKHITVFAVIAGLAIAGVGMAVSASAANNSVVNEAGRAKTLSAEDNSGFTAWGFVNNNTYFDLYSDISVLTGMDGVCIESLEGKLTHISVTGKDITLDYSTSLGVGSSKAEVMEAFGIMDAESEKSNILCIGANEKSSDKLYFYFDENDTVYRMDLEPHDNYE